MPVHPKRVRKPKAEPEVQAMLRIGDDSSLQQLLGGGLGPDAAGAVPEVRGAGIVDGAEKAPLCQSCGDVGYTFTVDAKGNRFAADCGCRAEQRCERQMIAAGLPERYALRGFADCQPAHETQRMALLYARGYVNHWPMHDRRGICLIGPTGTGKTHLAIAILRELLRKGAQGIYTSQAQLLKRIKNTYGDKAEQEEAILGPVVRAELLVMDDVGAGRGTPTDWEVEQMEFIFSERYDAGLPMILTSNLRLRPGPRKVEANDVAMYRQAGAGESLAERLGARVASRLGEVCEMLPVEGRDRRERQA